MRLLGESHILWIYDQGADSVVRLVTRLADRLEEVEAQLLRAPQPAIELLSKELARAKRTLARKTDELIRERQLHHQLLCRIREMEREVEGGTRPPVPRDSHNSSSPPSLDPPWRKVPRTTSLRKKSGMKVGGQPGHPGVKLRQIERPDHVMIHTPGACARCGADLDHGRPRALTRRQVFDISDGRMKVTGHRAEGRRCSTCRTITKAKFPASVCAPVQYGQGVVSAPSIFISINSSLSPEHRRRCVPSSAVHSLWRLSNAPPALLQENSFTPSSGSKLRSAHRGEMRVLRQAGLPVRCFGLSG